MSSKNDLTRKEFLTLTFTLIGGAAVGAAACSDNNNNNDGGFAGNNGNGGRGGTTGAAGQGGNGAAGHGGNGGAGGGGGASANSCTSPLPDTQLPDNTMHTHTLMIQASALDSGTSMSFDTGVTDGHMHMVTLQPADMATLKGGGNVTMTTSSAMAPGGPVHTHMFMISCH